MVSPAFLDATLDGTLPRPTIPHADLRPSEEKSETTFRETAPELLVFTVL